MQSSGEASHGPHGWGATLVSCHLVHCKEGQIGETATSARDGVVSVYPEICCVTEAGR